MAATSIADATDRLETWLAGREPDVITATA